MRLIDVNELDILGYLEEFPECENDKAWNAAVRAICAYVNSAHAVDAVPVVRGLWMPIYESEMTGWDPEIAGCDPIGGYICSICKEEAVYDCNDKFVLSNYCPNCGARMSEDKQ